MKDFFISYNGADKSWAEWIAWHLEAANYTTVIQAWDFRPGNNFVIEMQRAATEAHRTIGVLSTAYLNALYTQPEWAAAFADDPTGVRQKLVFVRVAECQPEGILKPLIYSDLVELDKQAAKMRLLSDLKEGRAKPTVEPAYPGDRSSVPEPRFPGTFPGIWNITHSRNPHFSGREDMLARLSDGLKSSQVSVLNQVVHGLGGVGKTQVAIEYAYRHAGDYDVVWWMRAEESATLASDYAGLAERLGLREKEDKDQRIIVSAVRRWLQQNRNWLLVFDNAGESEDLKEYLPGGSGHILITSRNPNWAHAGKISVEEWPRHESIRFLLNRTGKTDDTAADSLARDLGDLPLALEQAAAYIETCGISILEYLGLFRTRRQDLWKHEKPPQGYQATVATTWSVSMDRVSPEAAALMNLLAFLAPDDIPKDLLTKEADTLPEPLASVAADTLLINDAVANLRSYSLLDVAEGTYSVHRLVQSVTSDRLSDDDKKKWAGAAVAVVDHSFPEESEDVRMWPQCAMLNAHALIVADHAEKLNANIEATCRLLDHVGRHLWGRAQFREAKRVLDRALTLAEAAYESDHVQIAEILNSLAVVLDALGDFREARTHHERALKIRETAYGPDHPKVAMSLNDLGGVLYVLGELDGARKHHERALKIRETTYGPEHPKVAMSLNNLGAVLYALKDIKGAREHFERALDIDKAVYGPDHPNVATRWDNLGAVLMALGDLNGAREHREQALKIREAAYGPDHPDVATTLNNLGSVLNALGDLKGARAHSERALKIYEVAYGPDHPAVVTNLNNLGSVLYALKDIKGARAYFERALKININRLGANHPDAVKTRKNLAVLERQEKGKTKRGSKATNRSGKKHKRR